VGGCGLRRAAGCVHSGFTDVPRGRGGDGVTVTGAAMPTPELQEWRTGPGAGRQRREHKSPRPQVRPGPQEAAGGERAPSPRQDQRPASPPPSGSPILIPSPGGGTHNI
jgi:hypothetical protein